MRLRTNVRAAAAALMSGEWEHASMMRRLFLTFASGRWVRGLVDELAALPRPERTRDLVGWILARVAAPDRTAQLVAIHGEPDPSRTLHPHIHRAAALMMAGEWDFHEMYVRLAGTFRHALMLAHHASRLPRPAATADLVVWFEARLRELAATDPRAAYRIRAWLDPSVVEVRERADGSYEALYRTQVGAGLAVPQTATLDGEPDDELDEHGWLSAIEQARVARWPLEMSESPWRVPALATERELASWLGIGASTLTAYADRSGFARHYRYRWIAKRTGGHRLLEAPKPRLRQLQRYVLDGIVAAIPPHEAAHGFVAGRSVKTFVAPHVGRDVVIRVDLEAFFTSISAARVAAIFWTAGYPEGVARTLARLCTHTTPSEVYRDRAPTSLARLRGRHLPQGAPTSGALANLAAYRFDVRVAALAAAIGAHYTRYADDVVLSGDRRMLRAAPSLIARLGAIAFEEDFALNFRKTRVMTASERQHVAGLVLNARAAPPRNQIERLRATLHNCTQTGPAAQNRDGHPDFRAHLLGRISWVASVAPASGARLRAIFDRIQWDQSMPPAVATLI
jgi:RNA-directed DNA polymerase